MKTIEMYDVRVGDRVKWDSMVGTLRGEVVRIDTRRTAAGTWMPWLIVEHAHDNLTGHTALVNNKNYLDTMRLEVIFRDEKAN